MVAIRTGTTLTAMPLRILVIGQLSGGMVQPLVPVPVTDPSQPPALFVRARGWPVPWSSC
ncbi:hypothetical protein JCM25156A_28890 [Komagataeibacter kakiaceti JCM 25156]